MTTISLPQTGSRINIYNGDLEIDVATMPTLKSAESVAAKLSAPSKMPGYAYSLPASKCRTGAKLAKIPGTVCYGCYAADTREWLDQPGRASRWNRYHMDNVVNAMQRRHDSLQDPLWVPAMVRMIRFRFFTRKCNSKGGGYFRWHDSGDIQSLEHLRNIAIVAEATPNVHHWIPTREYKDVSAYLEKFGPFPLNLVVRVSAHRVNELAPKRFALSSIVVNGDTPAGASDCPAYQQGGKCGDCRSCWNAHVPIIAYPQH